MKNIKEYSKFIENEKIKKILAYTMYLGIMVTIVFIDYKFTNYIQLKLAVLFEFNIPWNLIKQLIPVLLGVLLGGCTFYKQLKKAGKWKVDKTRILILVIPLLVLSSGLIIIYAAHDFIIPVWIVEQEKLFQVVFGYILITSFKKDS